MTLQTSVTRVQGRGNTFVPATAPVQYTQGQALYADRKPLRYCLTDEAARGWNDAADADRRGAEAYLRAMEAEGLPSALALGAI